MSKTETDRSTIYRSMEHAGFALVENLLGIEPGLHATQIYDKESGQWGKGSGNTQAEADRAARDDLADKKG